VLLPKQKIFYSIIDYLQPQFHDRNQNLEASIYEFNVFIQYY
jgi:hypothetical protein